LFSTFYEFVSAVSSTGFNNIHKGSVYSIMQVDRPKTATHALCQTSTMRFAMLILKLAGKCGNRKIHFKTRKCGLHISAKARFYKLRSVDGYDQ